MRPKIYTCHRQSVDYLAIVHTDNRFFCAPSTHCFIVFSFLYPLYSNMLTFNCMMPGSRCIFRVNLTYVVSLVKKIRQPSSGEKDEAWLSVEENRDRE